MKNIYNIPANYHFFNSLSEFITQKFINDSDLSKLKYLKILLPNRRSCREFTKILTAKYPNVILPKIKAISDISYDDFCASGNQNNIPYLQNILKLKDYSKLEYLLFLAKEINNLDIFGFKKDFLESLKVSSNLAQLFEDIELQGINFNELSEIDDTNLPENKKVTLETLQILHLKIKKRLLNNDIYFGATKQNIIIDLYIDFLRESQPKHPIIIAGSTGSVLSGRKLIKAIAKNNYVILHGLNRSDTKEENHPQFFLNNLLEYTQINQNQVEDLKLTNQLSPDSRQGLLSQLMQPYSSLRAQRSNPPSQPDNGLPICARNDEDKESRSDLENNFVIVEAEDQIKEAKIIAQICNNLTKSKTAIITNNVDLVKYIRFELDKEKIEFNDTTNKSILSSKLIEFIKLILLNYENSCNSHSLLALIKHKYFDKRNCSNLIFELETKILRQLKENSQIDGILKACKSNTKITNFLKELKSDIFKISTYANLSNITDYIIEICEKFSNKSWLQILETQDANNEIHNLFQQLRLQESINIDPKKISNIFANLFSQTGYFLKSNPDAQVQILSTIEARLLNFDNVIIASLNENDFPQIEKAGWLGKKVKKDLGIDRQLKKVGQSSYDFCNYLSNSKVFLTRHKQKGPKELIESPFLLKFKNLVDQFDVNVDKSDHYNTQLQKRSDIKQINLSKPAGQPNDNQLFDQISITDITKLISNPYQIYIKKILKLKELKKIDYEPGYPEFGSFVHEVLEDYIKNNKCDNEHKLQSIFLKYFKNPNDKLVWWPKFENIFKNFKEIEQEFDNCESLVEENVNFTIKNTKIIGKVDRIIIKDGEIEVLDYKTGQTPTKKDIIAGLQSQLTIAALIISQNRPETVTALTYFKLSSFLESEIKRVFNKEEEISQLIISAQDGLAKLIDHFINNNQPFTSTKNEDIKEYQSLIRSEEWED